MHKAFISYTRSKDDFGSVENLQRRLVNELQGYEPGAMVFQDKQDLVGGDHFNDVIKAELLESDLFIILLSPAWLQNSYCKDEYHTFVEKEKALGIKPRLFPVLWVKEENDLGDPDSIGLLGDILQINYIKFWEYRHKDVKDSVYAQKIAEIARAAQETAARL